MASTSDRSRAQPARVAHEGHVLVLDEADVARIDARAAGMLGVLWSATYLRVRYKYPEAPEPVALALAAAALGVEPDSLRGCLPGAGRPRLVPASIAEGERTWSVEAHELEDLDDVLYQGSWFVAHLYPKMKARTGAIDAALALTAALLGDTVDAVRGALDWHDQYMRWHDADPTYTIF